MKRRDSLLAARRQAWQELSHCNAEGIATAPLVGAPKDVAMRIQETAVGKRSNKSHRFSLLALRCNTVADWPAYIASLMA
jgi:hypothetical protein